MFFFVFGALFLALGAEGQMRNAPVPANVPMRPYQALFTNQSTGGQKLGMGMLEVLRRVDSNRRLIAFEPGCSLADEDKTEVRCNESANLDFDKLYTVDSIYKFVCKGCQVKNNKLDKSFCGFAGTSNFGLYSAIFEWTNISLIDSNTFNCTNADKTVVRFVIKGTVNDELTLGSRVCGRMAQFDLLWIQAIRHLTFATDTFADCSLRSLLIDYADLATSNFDPRNLLLMRKVPVAIKFNFVRLDSVPQIWGEIFRRSEVDNGCIANFNLGGSGSVSVRCDQRLAWMKEYEDMENRLKLGNASCRYPPELVGRTVGSLRWERIVGVPTPVPDNEFDRRTYGEDP